MLRPVFLKYEKCPEGISFVLHLEGGAEIDRSIPLPINYGHCVRIAEKHRANFIKEHPGYTTPGKIRIEQFKLL